MLNVDRLKEALVYDADTGRFTWRINIQRARAGNAAGFPCDGYVVIGIDRKTYKAHRLAWLYMTGNWPVGDIDHINCVKDDNRFANLRDGPTRLNCENHRRSSPKKRSGLPLGVSAHEGKFWSRITVSGTTRSLGLFATPDAAYNAYVAAKRLHHEGCTI